MNSKRIVGVIPACPVGGETPLVDVMVRVGSSRKILPKAFRWLAPMAGMGRGFWSSLADLPDELDQIASCTRAGVIHVFGAGTTKSYAYEPDSGSWSDSLAERPYPGGAHGSEVIGGRVFLFGGTGASAGKVQIYDPLTDAWSFGADMPWQANGCSTGVINGLVYACGGLVGGVPVSTCGVYDPGTDRWNPGGVALASMPVGVHAGACGTDGQSLWVFGGLSLTGAGPPRDNVQRYDPVLDQWEDSGSASSSLVSMPLERAWTGRAVWLRGEFLIFGGEVRGVSFAEVQAYDPAGNSWRAEQPMPTPRGGIQPARIDSRVCVVGGRSLPALPATRANEAFQR